jgi:hypothetical protein
MLKTFRSFDFFSFDIISDFELRASNFITEDGLFL